MLFSYELKPEIKNELNKELLHHSLSAAFGFFIAAVWVTYQKFETVLYQDLVTILGICLMILPAARYVTGYLYEKNRVSLHMAVMALNLNIIINAALWLIAVFIPIYELELSSTISNITLITLLTGLPIASCITLSNNLTLAFLFQWLLLIPNMIYLYYLYFSKNNTAAAHLATMLIIIISYTLKHSLVLYRQAFRRITYSLELQETNKMLEESEKQLRIERSKLQYSTRLATMDELAGELTHEINNPLSIVKGNIELCLKSLKSEPINVKYSEKKLLQAISSISRITKIIAALKYFTRHSNIEQPKITIGINELITETLDFSIEKFSLNRINLSFNNAYNYPIFCRPPQISHVLLNIFSNAVTSLESIPVENRKIIITSTAEENFVKISIANTGKPIKQDIIPKLFEPFFSTRKNAHTGLGIGMSLSLSVSKEIIEEHNGTIYYDSEQPITTFVIKLPIQS